MLKPIIKNESFFYENMISFIKFKASRTLRIVIMTLIAYVLFFFLKPTVYSSRVSFYTNYQEDIQSSLLSMVPGFMSGGLADSSLDFSISNYIASDNFLFDIVNSTYTVNNTQVTLSEYWGQDYNNFFLFNPLSLFSRINRYFMFSDHLNKEQRMATYAATLLYNSIEYSENRKTKLHHISLEIQDDPKLAKDIMDNIYISILSYSNEITNSKAAEKKQFISARLDRIKKDLRDSENRLLIFEEQNKINYSPKLTLEKSRIQRDVSLHEQLYFTLSDQLELAKISEKDNTSSFFLLDQPGINPIKGGLSLAKGGLLIVLLTSFLCYLYYSIIFRKELFN